MLHVCQGCGTRYAESLAVCPHCGCEDRRPDYEEDTMPKISRDGTVTYEPGREPPGTPVPESREHAGTGADTHAADQPPEGTPPEAAGSNASPAPADPPAGASEAAAAADPAPPKTTTAAKAKPTLSGPKTGG